MHRYFLSPTGHLHILGAPLGTTFYVTLENDQMIPHSSDDDASAVALHTKMLLDWMKEGYQELPPSRILTNGEETISVRPPVTPELHWESKVPGKAAVVHRNRFATIGQALVACADLLHAKLEQGFADVPPSLDDPAVREPGPPYMRADEQMETKRRSYFADANGVEAGPELWQYDDGAAVLSFQVQTRVHGWQLKFSPEGSLLMMSCVLDGACTGGQIVFDDAARSIKVSWTYKGACIRRITVSDGVLSVDSAPPKNLRRNGVWVEHDGSHRVESLYDAGNLESESWFRQDGTLEKRHRHRPDGSIEIEVYREDGSLAEQGVQDAEGARLSSETFPDPALARAPRVESKRGFVKDPSGIEPGDLTQLLTEAPSVDAFRRILVTLQTLQDDANFPEQLAAATKALEGWPAALRNPQPFFVNGLVDGSIGVDLMPLVGCLRPADLCLEPDTNEVAEWDEIQDRVEVFSELCHLAKGRVEHVDMSPKAWIQATGNNGLSFHAPFDVSFWEALAKAPVFANLKTLDVSKPDSDFDLDMSRPSHVEALSNFMLGLDLDLGELLQDAAFTDTLTTLRCESLEDFGLDPVTLPALETLDLSGSSRTQVRRFLANHKVPSLRLLELRGDSTTREALADPVFGVEEEDESDDWELECQNDDEAWITQRMVDCLLTVVPAADIVLGGEVAAGRVMPTPRVKDHTYERGVTISVPW